MRPSIADSHIVGFLVNGNAQCIGCTKIMDMVVPLYDTNIHPYTQSCSICDGILYLGAVETQLFTPVYYCQLCDVVQVKQGELYCTHCDQTVNDIAVALHTAYTQEGQVEQLVNEDVEQLALEFDYQKQFSLE